jgi:hypothetical protein
VQGAQLSVGSVQYLHELREPADGNAQWLHHVQKTEVPFVQWLLRIDARGDEDVKRVH